jgi:hypothetical protein
MNAAALGSNMHRFAGVAWVVVTQTATQKLAIDENEWIRER